MDKLLTRLEASPSYETSAFRDGIVVTGTGFFHESRAALRKLCAYAGIHYSGDLVRGLTTILVVKDSSGQPSPKLLQARKWRLPAVRLSWLLDSISLGSPLPVHAYLLPGYTASEQARTASPSARSESAPSRLRSNDGCQSSRNNTRRPLHSVDNIVNHLKSLALCPEEEQCQPCPAMLRRDDDVGVSADPLTLHESPELELYDVFEGNESPRRRIKDTTNDIKMLSPIPSVLTQVEMSSIAAKEEGASCALPTEDCDAFTGTGGKLGGGIITDLASHEDALINMRQRVDPVAEGVGSAWEHSSSQEKPRRDTGFPSEAKEREADEGNSRFNAVEERTPASRLSSEAEDWCLTRPTTESRPQPSASRGEDGLFHQTPFAQPHSACCLPPNGANLAGDSEGTCSAAYAFEKSNEKAALDDSCSEAWDRGSPSYYMSDTGHETPGEQFLPGEKMDELALFHRHGEADSIATQSSPMINMLQTQRGETTESSLQPSVNAEPTALKASAIGANLDDQRPPVEETAGQNAPFTTITPTHLNANTALDGTSFGFSMTLSQELKEIEECLAADSDDDVGAEPVATRLPTMTITQELREIETACNDANAGLSTPWSSMRFTSNVNTKDDCRGFHPQDDTPCNIEPPDLGKLVLRSQDTDINSTQLTDTTFSDHSFESLERAPVIARARGLPLPPPLPTVGVADEVVPINFQQRAPRGSTVKIVHRLKDTKCLRFAEDVFLRIPQLKASVKDKDSKAWLVESTRDNVLQQNGGNEGGSVMLMQLVSFYRLLGEDWKAEGHRFYTAGEAESIAAQKGCALQLPVGFDRENELLMGMEREHVYLGKVKRAVDIRKVRVSGAVLRIKTEGGEGQPSYFWRYRFDDTAGVVVFKHAQK